MIKRASILAFFFLLAINCLRGQSQIENSLVTKEILTVDTLRNGFRYYLLKRPKKGISVQFVVKAGFNQESRTQLQVAHVLEHLAYRQTKHFPSPMSYFKQMGIELNASTENDRTVFFMEMPSNDFKQLQLVINFFRDCVNNIVLNHTNIKSERGVVQEELQMGKNAFYDQDIVRRQIARNSPLNDIRAEDEFDNVSKFKRIDLVKYYNDWYRPDLQALILVGDIDIDKTAELIDKTFSKLERPVGSEVKRNSNYTSKGDTTINVTNIEDIRVNNNRIELYTSVENDLDNEETKIIREFFDELMKVRVEATNIDLRYARNLTAHFEVIRNRGFDLATFKVRFEYLPETCVKALSEVLLKLRQIDEHGFTEEEFRNTKQMLLAKYKDIERARNGSIANSIAESFVSDRPYVLHKTGAYHHVNNLLEKINLKIINSELHNWITFRRKVDLFNIASEIDRHDHITEDKIISIVDSVSICKTLPFKLELDHSNSVSQALSSYIPNKLQSKMPTRESHDILTNITTIDLPNGIKILLKPIPTDSSGKVYIRQMNCTALKAQHEEMTMLDKYSHYIVSASGLSHFKGEELKRFYSHHGIEYVTPYKSRTEVGLRAVFSSQSLETVLQSIYLYFTEPKVDTSVLKAVEIQTITKPAGNISNILVDTLNYFRYGKNRNLSLKGGQADEMTELNVLEYFIKNFSRTHGTKFLVAGSFDLNRYRDLLIKYLSAIPENGTKQIEDTVVQFSPKLGARNIVMYSGNATQAEVRADWSFQSNNDLISIVTLDLTKEYLQNILFERLRVKDGGVYFVVISSYINRAFHTAGITVFFLCSPSNYNRLIEAVNDEIQKVLKNGINESLLKALALSKSNDMKSNLSQSDFWINYMSEQIRASAPINEVYEELRLLESFDTNRVQTLIRDNINPRHLSTYVLCPTSEQSN